ncbi:baseplate hub protein [Serratia quinivorans]|uniref:baseplate hub protein n=1 Tax=Serratia quinivorans TaxID=137545 RepID=UPI0034C6C90A
MTYKKRSLKFQFTLKSGKFDESGNDILTIDNIKAEVEVGAFGGVSGTTLEARVYGLSEEKMALLSYKGIQINGPAQNMVKIWADDKPIFFGAIMSCYADMNQMPDAPLMISANATGYDQSVRCKDFFVKGVVLVSDIIKSIAKSIDYTVVDSGVATTVENPFYSGNAIEQITKCAQDAGIEIDIRLGIIYIWPQNGDVDAVVPYVSPENGLIGYPIFNNYGVTFQCVYSNLITRGRRVKLKTSIPNASGSYVVVGAVHYLSSWTEGGPWMTIVHAAMGELDTVRQ